MNYNVALDHPAFVAWDGKTSYARSVAGCISFGFTFEAVEDITTDAYFVFDAAPASETDPNQPGDIFTVLNKVNTCSIPSKTDEQETFIIPAGTKKGDVITGTIPCAPDKFIRLVGQMGDIANVRAVIVLQGKGA